MSNIEQENNLRNWLFRLLRVVVGLPGWLMRELENPKERGKGLHQYYFNTARQLHPHLTPDTVFAVLMLLCPDADAREVRDAVVNSEAVAWQPRGTGWKKVYIDLGQGGKPPRSSSSSLPAARPSIGATHRPAVPRWAEPNLNRIERLARQGPGLAELRSKSDVDPLPDFRHTGRILEKLFPPDALLCLGLDQQHSYTLPLAEWLAMPVHELQFIVPSPMTKRIGTNLEGRPSFRCLDNTGPRQFLVVECDFAERSRSGKTETIYAPLIRKLAADSITVADMCAAVLWRLARYLPLAMVVFSGRVSQHGWFNVSGLPDDDVLVFMRYARTLGADPATWTRCQLVRLPDGTRGWSATGEAGARQTIEYFDERALEVLL